MIQLQTQRTKLPTRAAAGRRGAINTAALVTSVALVAQLLSACSSQTPPAVTVAAQYPDLNDPTPTAEVRADQVAQIKAELLQVRDNQVRAAVRQQAFR